MLSSVLVVQGLEGQTELLDGLLSMAGRQVVETLPTAQVRPEALPFSEVAVVVVVALWMPAMLRKRVALVGHQGLPTGRPGAVVAQAGPSMVERELLERLALQLSWDLAEVAGADKIPALAG